LLKKLCIHIYRQAKEGTKQGATLAGQIDLKSLFEEDLELLTSREQLACLKYIAANSPADKIDVLDQFEQETVNSLIENRLIVTSGPKYVVYWDVFRDYLVSNTVPVLPLTYVPQAQLSTALKSFFALQKNSSLDMAKLASDFGYSQKTVFNVISDLQTFMLVSRDHQSLAVVDALKDASNDQVASYLSHQLNDHIVVKELNSRLQPGEKMRLEQFRGLFADAYPAANFRPETLDAYSSKILPWLKFPGLVEVDQEQNIIRPVGTGKQKGSVTGLGFRIPGPRKGLFISTSQPGQVIGLAMQLRIADPCISRKRLSAEGLSHAATDLVCLQLAKWTKEGLTAGEELNSISRDNAEKEIYDLIRCRVMTSPFFEFLRQAQGHRLRGSREGIATRVTEEFNRSWSLSSAERYISAGRMWLSYFEDSSSKTMSLFD
jgi:hypothetical protein